MDLLTPWRSPDSALPLRTQQFTARGSVWGLPSLSLTIKGKALESTLGEGRKPLVSPLSIS